MTPFSPTGHSSVKPDQNYTILQHYNFIYPMLIPRSLNEPLDNSEGWICTSLELNRITEFLQYSTSELISSMLIATKDDSPCVVGATYSSLNPPFTTFPMSKLKCKYKIGSKIIHTNKVPQKYTYFSDPIPFNELREHNASSRVASIQFSDTFFI